MAMTNTPYVIINRDNEHNLFKGAITENFVAQQLKAKGHALYYWKNNAHEVDFDEMLKRLNAYKKDEEISYSAFLESLK